MTKTTSNKSYSESISFISTTDCSSYITYANKDFCDIAEYSADELRGNPHNIVRHPDMPKAAFAQLWSYVKRGDSWMGLVKNRCKGPRHYWVSAFVTPIKNADGKVVEYQSIRSKPTAEQVARAEALYAKMNNNQKVSSWRFSSLSLTQGLFVTSLLVSLVGSFMSSPWWLTAASTILGLGALLTSFYCKMRMNQVNKLACEAYDNPLMETVYTGRFDDFSAIELSLMMRKAELRAVVARCADTSERILSDANEELENMREVEQRLTSQQHETDQVATAVEELNYAINDIANNAAESSNFTEDAQSVSQVGLQKIDNTIEQIRVLDAELANSRAILTSLSEHTQKVDMILDVINTIAEQTNLLALNAAIEAARAGESGRGFAVVADEVRQLAAKTGHSTHEIQAMIGELQQLTNQVVASMNQGSQLSERCKQRADETGQVIRSISDKLGLITDKSQQTAAAVEQQATVTKEIAANTMNIKLLTEKTSASSGESVDRTRDLVDNLEDLSRLIQQFKA
ncbi:PAS domain-containing methyl-accepting chemotaxis protein [Vibrio tritonius]|uniref:methyl-accepting chemotaxis protein n=1 Tax=Vibrio tritonius TaxID=1435069 RepID=UPI00315D11DC